MAVFLAPKKLTKLPLEAMCQASGFTLLVLTEKNWRALLCSRVVIDVLLHKLADFSADQGNCLDLFEEYRRVVTEKISRGEVVRLVDSFEVMDLLQCRHSMLCAIERHVQGLDGLQVPRWSLDIQDLSNEKLVIAKPMDACGAPNSHLMQLVSCENRGFAINDHIFQSFISHHRTLYKLYVIGQHVDIVIRSSISESIFSSHDAFEYGVTIGKAQLCNQALIDGAMARIRPHLPAIHEFINRFSNEHQLSLFGVDVLVTEDSNCTANIIDVNYFPGFDGVSDLSDKLSKTLFA